MPAERPNVTYSAPVGSVDLAAFEPDGTPLTMWPCTDCLSWHAEIVSDDGYVLVREWHAIDRKTFKMLTAEVLRER